MKVSGSDREYELVEWRDDWVSTITLPDGIPYNDKGKWFLGVLDPRRVLLTEAEVATLQQDHDLAMQAWAENRVPATGTFWKTWELHQHPGGVGFLAEKS